MSDIYSVLQSSYASATLNLGQDTGKYVPVNAADYQGSWKGTYPDSNKPFSFTISDVSGFRARVKYQSGQTVQYQDVLIKNASFRIGDTKFTLSGTGAAQIKNAVTSPIDGSVTLETANAAKST